MFLDQKQVLIELKWSNKYLSSELIELILLNPTINYYRIKGKTNKGSVLNLQNKKIGTWQRKILPTHNIIRLGNTDGDVIAIIKKKIIPSTSEYSILDSNGHILWKCKKVGVGPSYKWNMLDSNSNILFQASETTINRRIEIRLPNSSGEVIAIIERFKSRKIDKSDVLGHNYVIRILSRDIDQLIALTYGLIVFIEKEK